MVFTHTLQPRFQDLDTWRHVNNTAMVQLHQELRMQALMQVLGPQAWFSDGPRLRPLRSVTRFQRVSRYGEPLHGEARILSVSGQHFVMHTRLYQYGECVGVQDCVMGALLDAGPVALPEAVRQALESALAGTPERAPGGSESRESEEGGATLTPPTYLQAPDALSAYPAVTELLPRYGDLDVDSRLGEAALARYTEQARFGLVDTLTMGEQGLLIAQLDMTVHHDRPPRGKLILASAVSRVGNSSFHVQAVVMTEGKPQVTAHGVMVVVNPETERPEPIAAALRAQLEGLRQG